MMVKNSDNKGLLHIYTGEGKGKTTAAIGLAVRARGVGMRVLFCQFLKGLPSGEVEMLRALSIPVFRTDPVKKFFAAMDGEERRACTDSCRRLLERAGEAMADGGYGLVVLDEVFAAIGAGILSEGEVCALLDKKAPGTEVVLTGRSPGRTLLERADYVTDMRAVKHPYERGVAARRGIEF